MQSTCGFIVYDTPHSDEISLWSRNYHTFSVKQTLNLQNLNCRLCKRGESFKITFQQAGFSGSIYFILLSYLKGNFLLFPNRKYVIRQRNVSANIIIKYTCSIHRIQMINEMERALAISSWTSCSKGYASTGRHSQIGFVSHKIPKVEHKSESSSLLRGQYFIRRVSLYFSREGKKRFFVSF